MSQRTAYLNWKYLPESEAKVSILDLGFRIGDGVYDVARTYRHRPFKLREHIQRLFRSLRFTRISIDLTPAEFEAVCLRVLEANVPLLRENEDYSLWMNVSRGQPQGPGAGPTVAVSCVPINFQGFAHAFTEGIRLRTSSIRRIPPECLDPKAKVTNKMNHILADLDVKSADPDAYSLMLDVHGNLAENSAANLFLVKKGRLLTPSRRNVLEGVTRETVLELAHSLRIPAEEGDLTLYDAYTAEEAFLTGTTPTILPVRSLDGREYPGDVPGPMTTRLLRSWSELVGMDIIAQTLSHVNP